MTAATGGSLFDIDDDLDDGPTADRLETPKSGNVDCDEIDVTKEQLDDDEFSDKDDADLLDAVKETEMDHIGEEISRAQRARAERNRLKAISLKKSRLRSHPFNKEDKKISSQQQPRIVDSGGGFFIEEEDENQSSSQPAPVMETLGPILPYDQPSCQTCEKKFGDSFLFRTFEHEVCDNCRDTSRDGEHELIAKTEAKTTFLLRDFDFDDTEHGKALKFINRKNPHNPRGGEMKLFLRLQVEERAIQIWGSEEALQKEIETREEKKIEAKAKKYKKQIKELRMAARSSLYKKDISAHVHEYKDEIYHEDKDEYSQTCQTCGHINIYEKL